MKEAQAFGVKTTFEQADLILIPAPWEATASYGAGTSRGPELIRRASQQLDFFNPDFNCSYNQKIYFEKSDSHIVALNQKAGMWSQEIQKNWEENKSLSEKEKALADKVNQASLNLLNWIHKKSSDIFKAGKIPALIGGEHSVSEGLISATGEKFEYGLLHLDAHADLRQSYQGFKHSHASIMHNILNLNFPPQKLVQVAVRDFCEEEYQQIKQNEKIDCFFDRDISFRLFNGEKWSEICQQIIALLPSKVYVSLDVDALSWNYAPGTGTPVPGGLSFNQVLYLLAEIKRQNKKLIAFDVVESSGGEKFNAFSEWNGNVSARLIYYLSGLALWSHNKLNTVQ